MIADGRCRNKSGINHLMETALTQGGGEHTFADDGRQGIKVDQKSSTTGVQPDRAVGTGGLIVEHEPVIAGNVFTGIQCKAGQVEFTGSGTPKQANLHSPGSRQRGIGTFDQFFHAGYGNPCQ